MRIAFLRGNPTFDEANAAAEAVEQRVPTPERDGDAVHLPEREARRDDGGGARDSLGP